MDKEYIEILQQLLVSEQLRLLSFKGFESDNIYCNGSIEYNVNDLEKIYFELEKIGR